MSNNKVKRTSHKMPVNFGSGPFVAKVVGHLDQTYMGSLKVQILYSSTSGNRDSQEKETRIVKYASPFYGVTPLESSSGDDNYRSTQQSYGMWMVPPDIGTLVLVIFAEGHADYGYWIACIADDYMNFMVPGGYAATELTTPGTPPELIGKKLPVGEYNKHTVTPDKFDPTLYPKPYNYDFTQILEIQGLLDDESRGTTTSSARREVPSAVFGINTPGPLDKRIDAPTGKVGTKSQSANVFRSRLGGSSFVMDDGDDKFVRRFHASDHAPEYLSRENDETEGDDTIPQNELIRLRTRTGHQILLHNSEDLIYIANSRGTAWIELSSDGKIDIHAQDSISVMSDNDINFTAERDFNVEAGRNVNIKASARSSDGNAVENGVPSGRIRLESTHDTEIHTGADSKHTILGTYDINVKQEMKTTVSDNYNLHSLTNIFQKADSAFHQTAGQSLYHTSGNSTYNKAGAFMYNDAAGSIYQKSGMSIINSAARTFCVDSGTSTHLKSTGTFNVDSSSSLHLKSNGTFNLKSGSTSHFDSSGTLSLMSSEDVALAGTNVHLNSAGKATAGADGTAGTTASPAIDAAEPTDSRPISKLTTVTLPYMLPGASKAVPYESILTRAPQHEPWTHHENMNPQAFKKAKTDRESPGELPSNDRVLTPDTFLRNTIGRSTSGYVYDPAPGTGQDGATSTAKGTTQGTVKIPEGQGDRVDTVNTKSGPSALVAKALVPAFQGFINDLEATGYPIKEIHGIFTKNALSHPINNYHSIGAAIDINPETNGYYSPKRTKLPTDMPKNVSELAKKHGLGWGGDATEYNNAMHFSAAKEEGGSYDLKERLANNEIPPLPPNKLNTPDHIPDDYIEAAYGDASDDYVASDVQHNENNEDGTFTAGP